MKKNIPKIFRDLTSINPNHKVIFCKKCVISNQRPRLLFNKDGVCAACLFSEYKKTIDWDKREKELSQLCDKFRSKDGKWDVIVPGSGGKDSHYVAYRLKKDYGMTPLSVTWAQMSPTEIGRKNLTNFIASGFDNIFGSPNIQINRKLSKMTFMQFGDGHLPFIYGMINFPLQIAVKYKIPLLFFGEDGEVEYGGNMDRFDQPKLEMNYTIKSKFTSLSPTYWQKFGIGKNELQYYMPPDLKELRKAKIQAHYFSYYENWKPEKNYHVAKKYLGFKPDKIRTEGTYTNFAGLDDKLYGFHYYMAFIKFGIGRATADACHQIRDGVISRKEAVSLVKKYDHEYPQRYESEFLDYVSVNRVRLHQIIDKFRRPLIWKKEKNLWKLRYQVSNL